MNWRILALFVLACVLMSAMSASAFDDERRGFILGLGAGFGSAKQTVTASAGGLSVDASTSTGGFATDFRIGGGINDQFLLYWTGQQVFFSEFDELWAQGISGLGAAYFLEPTAPSLFFEAVLGVGGLIWVKEFEADTGFGFSIGAGYEFSPHWCLQASYFRANVGSDSYAGVSMDQSVSSFRVTISWLAY